MAIVRSHPADYYYVAPSVPIVHALKENKRPIGFAPWPERDAAKDAEPTIKKPKKDMKKKLGVK